MYTHFIDMDWDYIFYTSPNCTNKIHYLLIETPHGYWDDIGHTLVPIISCMPIDRLTGCVSVEYLYLMLMQCRMNSG